MFASESKDLRNLLTYYHTSRNLSGKQILYYVWYRWIKRVWLGIIPYSKYFKDSLRPFPIPALIYPVTAHYQHPSVSIFGKLLNIENGIDWNFQGHGKLWNYHLQYLDLLLDDSVSIVMRSNWLKDISQKILSRNLPLEPYPVSLRILHTLDYLAKNHLDDPIIDKALKFQIAFLEDNVEYHLSGNHLLENYIALVYGHFSLQSSKKLERFLSKLLSELELQILPDGAHYETCLSYHAAIFCRLAGILPLLDRLPRHQNRAKELTAFLAKMYAWLREITRTFTVFPLINDSVSWPDLNWQALKLLAERHQLDRVPSKLTACGYRWLESDSLNLLMRVGPMACLNQPGHTHADYLHISLYAQGKAVLVDTGISTYEASAIRLHQRSTMAHNAVVMEGEQQSELWSAFRMARRASITSFTETEHSLDARVKWYQGYEHRRQVICEDSTMRILDHWTNQNGKQQVVALFHVDHDVHVQLHPTGVFAGDLLFEFEGAQHVEIVNDQQCIGMENILPSQCVRVYFCDQLTTTIKPQH